ncbi:MAG: hypothetical protein ACMG55_14510 [Microcoleus sp.]
MRCWEVRSFFTRIQDAQKHAKWFVNREFDVLVGRQELAFVPVRQN